MPKSAGQKTNTPCTANETTKYFDEIPCVGSPTENPPEYFVGLPPRRISRGTACPGLRRFFQRTCTHGLCGHLTDKRVMPVGHSGWAAGGGRPVRESEFGRWRVAVLARCRAATRRALMAQATMLSPPAAFSDERPFPSPFLATHSSFIRQTVDHIGGLVPDRRFRLHAGIAPSPSPSSTTDYLWAHLFSGGAVNSTWFCMPYYQPPLGNSFVIFDSETAWHQSNEGGDSH